MKGRNRIQRQRETFAYRFAGDIDPRQFSYAPDGDRDTFSLYDSPDDPDTENPLSEMFVFPSGEIEHIHTRPDVVRNGYATALLDWARTIRPDIVHSDNQSEEGALWRASEEARQRQANSYRFAAEELGQDFGPAAQSLINRLQGEFDQWASDNGIIEHPFERGDWKPDNPRGPIGHWPYIENFLEDNYPAAHRGLQYGMETAQPLMDGYSKLYNKPVEDRWVGLNGGTYQTGPEAVAQHGYDPKEIAAAFLYLHNRSHAFRNTDEWIDQDVDRLFDIFQKRMKMQRNYEQRQARHIVTARDHRIAANQDLINRLEQEFNEWAGPNGSRAGIGPYPKYLPGHWPYMEKFFKENYPAVYRGLDMGREEAGPKMKYDAGTCPDCEGSGFVSYGIEPEQDWCVSCGGEGEIKNQYETGPEAVSRHGYDPKEIAAAGLALHIGTGNTDVPDKVLNDIAQKRYQMQRNYEQRQANSRRIANDLVKEYTDQLYDEFHDWAANRPYVPVGFLADDPLVKNPDYTKPMGGPLTYWDNIEGFFKDNYPEAYRGFNMAEEKARPLMDTGYNSWGGGRPYETGPEAEAKYGYDPRQLAAGMMYLHTWSHAQSPQNRWRGDKLPRDIDRLAEIFQKRQQMQRDYEQRQANSIYRFGSWFHPEIGIEEYPTLTRKQQKALYREIISQGGPKLLSNVYHPENWGSGDPGIYHHYVARGQDGTIHGVLTAFRDYQKMEPKRKSKYPPNLWVHDVYTGDDAPKGTGTALMQAAAHRAMRDGANFSVTGVVPHASGFYHTLGGTRTPNWDIFTWASEDRDALAMGTPNPKPITPMSGRLVGNPNPPFNNVLVDPVMPPSPDDPVEMWQKFVPHDLRKRQQRQANLA